MRASEGPFPMETIYRFEETRDGHTHMTLQNRGEPTGVSKLVAPMIAALAPPAERPEM